MLWLMINKLLTNERYRLFLFSAQFTHYGRNTHHNFLTWIILILYGNIVNAFNQHAYIYGDLLLS